MTTTYGNHTAVRKIQLDTLDVGNLENREARAIMEILLELANDDLEVYISDTEVRTLLAIYIRMYRAAPFIGLRELIEADDEVELFFLDIRELITEKDPVQRAEQWKQAYKNLCDWVQYPTRAIINGPLSPCGEELLAHAQEALVLEYQHELFIQRPRFGRQYKN